MAHASHRADTRPSQSAFMFVCMNADLRPAALPRLLTVGFALLGGMLEVFALWRARRSTRH